MVFVLKLTVVGLFMIMFCVIPEEDCCAVAWEIVGWMACVVLGVVVGVWTVGT